MILTILILDLHRGQILGGESQIEFHQTCTVIKERKCLTCHNEFILFYE